MACSPASLSGIPTPHQQEPPAVSVGHDREPGQPGRTVAADAGVRVRAKRQSAA
jgi:hypothetical protein